MSLVPRTAEFLIPAKFNFLTRRMFRHLVFRAFAFVLADVVVGNPTTLVTVLVLSVRNRVCSIVGFACDAITARALLSLVMFLFVLVSFALAPMSLVVLDSGVQVSPYVTVVFLLLAAVRCGRW